MLRIPPGFVVPPDVAQLVIASSYDLVMFVNNAVHNDWRVVKTAESLTNIGKKVLLIGRADSSNYEIAYTRAGIPIIQLPSLNQLVAERLRLAKATASRGVRYELWMSMAATMALQLIARIRSERLTIHTHDFLSLQWGGNVVRALRRYSKFKQPVRWIHDVHEFVAGYDIIDPTLQAAGCLWETYYYRHCDMLTTVSPELATRLFEK